MPTYRPVLVSLFVLAGAGWGPIASAQGECPYGPEETVADSLDAVGYYPLQVGNVWEIRTSPNLPVTAGEIRREEVVGDTLVGGLRHWAIQTTRYYQVSADTLRAVVDPRTTYLTVDADGVLVRDFAVEVVRLGHPLNACYYPEGRSSGPFVSVNRPPGSPLGKAFADPAGYRSYEWGWGPVEVDEASEGGVTYARVGGRERGTPFADRVGVVVPAEPGPDAGRPALAVWPNPAGGAATAALTLPAPADVRVDVYDVLGRRVAVLAAGPLGAGRHRLPLDAVPLAPGVYVVRAEVGGAAVVARRLTVAR